MFIKLPSGMIIQIEKIVQCYHSETGGALFVVMVNTNSLTNDKLMLMGKDAKRLYEYLESIAIE